jgi:hemolysin activation/secretion protein
VAAETEEGRLVRHFLLIFLFVLAPGMVPLLVYGADSSTDVVSFTINHFDVVGNTKLTPNEIDLVLKPHAGTNKTAQDVEAARTELERTYHKKGYPTALVNIPEQTVESGTVQLQVIESNIRRIRITGNKYFTMESILKKMPSFRPGEILYLPDIQQELAAVNSHPDIKVAPVLVPGKELGTVDVELKVKDKLPLHGSLELNNQNTHDTTDLRLNALIRYDNLWQKEHSITFQYQMSPEDTDEVKALAASYVTPALWDSEQITALYGVASDSEVAFGQGFQTVGKGYIVGFRNVIPFPSKEKYSHSLSLGVDYKDFDDTLSFVDGEDETETPIKYLPLSMSYNSMLNHHAGSTKFIIGVNTVFRGLVSEREEFEDKRAGSRGNYIYTTLGIERYQTLPRDFQLFIKCDGQISDQPLPSNEQFLAGGLKSVRGYKENEEAGDNAIHGTVELSYPGMARLFRLPEWITASPNLFYDIAALRLIDPLDGQDQPNDISGAGAGIRGQISRYLEYEFSWGVALKDTSRTEKGHQEVYFVVKGQF